MVETAGVPTQTAAVATNECKQVQRVHGGVQRSARGYKQARGSTTECRRVQTSAGVTNENEHGGVRTSAGEYERAR